MVRVSGSLVGTLCVPCRHLMGRAVYLTWIMRILDIDLDFFLNTIHYWGNGDERLSEGGFVPWSEQKVIHFLEVHCGIAGKKIRGRIVTKHNEALYFWEELSELEL